MSDAARASRYVDDAFYGKVVAAFSGWQRDADRVVDPGVRAACEALLLAEARHLDNGEFEAWLALFVAECAYWAPGAPSGGDPRREIAMWFDDRRQMEGRVYRLRTGYAWSQQPPSRTVRQVTNVEVFRGPDAASVRVRSNLVVHELRGGDGRTLAGWCGYWLRPQDGELRIVAKQVNLLECDRALRNPSLLL